MPRPNAMGRPKPKIEDPMGRLQPAEKEGTLCAVYLETDDETGLCQTIRPVRLGAHLIATR